MPKIQKPKETAPEGDKSKGPNYGAPGEKQAREKLDDKHHHGGRTQTPDADVNPAKKRHVEDERRR